MKRYSRINVVGPSGSGKSTLAKKISALLSVDYIEMDQIFWGKNWSQPNEKEFLENIKLRVDKEQWVLDGNYTRTIDIKWERVQAVVWIDLPFVVVFSQAFRRAISRMITKKELWPGTGNVETFSQTFLSKNSILLWTLNTLKSVRRKYESLSNDEKYKHIDFYRLKSKREIIRFLSELEKANL
jgi:adenylate kinase family enzyme